MTHSAQLRRYAFFAAAKGEYLTASHWLLRVVLEDRFAAPDCSNLAYLAFNYCSRSARAALLEKLQQGGIDVVGKIPAVQLHLSLLIDQNVNDAVLQIKENYVDRFVRPAVLRRPEKPLVFWHIPKCSGTSINEAVGSWYYDRPVHQLLPGYSYKPLLSKLVERFMEEIPFLPSMHFGVDQLPPVRDCVQCTVLRDPVERAMSMYRQEAAVNRLQGQDRWHHFRALPRYGAFWDYREDRSVHDWMRNVPRQLLLRQLTTFSQGEVLDTAYQRLMRLDYVLVRGRGIGSQDELLREFGVEPESVEVASDLNQSDASVPVPDAARRALVEELAGEYALLSRFDA